MLCLFNGYFYLVSAEEVLEAAGVIMGWSVVVDGYGGVRQGVCVGRGKLIWAHEAVGRVEDLAVAVGFWWLFEEGEAMVAVGCSGRVMVRWFLVDEGWFADSLQVEKSKKSR